MVLTRETWAEGSEPGDPPISSEIVPETPEQARSRGRRSRLALYVSGPQTEALTARALTDLILELGVGP